MVAGAVESFLHSPLTTKNKKARDAWHHGPWKRTLKIYFALLSIPPNDPRCHLTTGTTALTTTHHCTALMGRRTHHSLILQGLFSLSRAKFCFGWRTRLQDNCCPRVVKTWVQSERLVCRISNIHAARHRAVSGRMIKRGDPQNQLVRCCN